MINLFHKKNIWGSLLAGAGFLLSPLSWWNDIIINIPLAYAAANLLNYFVPGYFSMYMILAYWLTNVLGLVLLHKGGLIVLGVESKSYNIRSVVKDLSVSLLYSLILAILVITGLLKLPTEYF